MPLTEAISILKNTFKTCEARFENEFICSDKYYTSTDTYIEVYFSVVEPKKVKYIRYQFASEDPDETLRTLVETYNLSKYVSPLCKSGSKCYKLPSGEVFGWQPYADRSCAGGQICPSSPSRSIEIMDSTINSADAAEAERLRRAKIPEPKF